MLAIYFKKKGIVYSKKIFRLILITCSVTKLIFKWGNFKIIFILIICHVDHVV